MKILIITKDNFLIDTICNIEQIELEEITIYNGNFFYQEMFESLHYILPEVIILDDDCIHPNSDNLIINAKNIIDDLKIIFFTSDNSIDLGRRISQHGIFFYGIKPLIEEEIKDSIISVINLLYKNK